MHSLAATLHRPVPVLNPNLMCEDLVRFLAMARVAQFLPFLAA